jgi:hypothetical protein
LNPPGRFLSKKVIPGSNKVIWYDIGDDAARKRTSKSLGEKKGSPTGFFASRHERKQSSGSSSASNDSDCFNKGTSELSQQGSRQEGSSQAVPFVSSLPSQQEQDLDGTPWEDAFAVHLESRGYASNPQGTMVRNTSKVCTNLPKQRLFQETCGADVVRHQQQLFFSLPLQRLDATVVRGDEGADTNSGIGNKLPTAAELLQFCLGDGLLFDGNKDDAVMDPISTGFAANRIETTHMPAESFAGSVMFRHTVGH